MNGKLMGMVLILSVAVASPAFAGIDSVAWIGELADNNGVPITGSASAQVDVFDAEVGGNLLQSQSFTEVVVKEGVFTVLIAKDVFVTESEPFMEFTVDGQVLTPRLAVYSQPFAIRATIADIANDVVAVAGFDSTELVNLVQDITLGVAQNEEEIAANTAANAATEAKATNNHNKIDANTANIAANTAANAATEAKATNNHNKIDANTANIAANTAANAATEAKATNNHNKIDANTANIAANTAANAATEAKATNNHNKIDANTANIAANTAANAATEAKATNNHNNIDANTAAIAAVDAKATNNHNNIDDLQAQIDALQAQVDGLSNGGGAVEPAVLGLTNVSTNGKPEVPDPTGGILAGVQAVNQLCKNTFTGEPTAHVCTEDDLYDALVTGNIAASVDGAKAYILGHTTDGFTYDGSVNNNCLNFNYNSGHVASGTTAQFNLNGLSTFPQGNLGGTKPVPIFNVQQDQGCGTARQSLCCR
jgi:hypothetical protein